ncbi:MAG: NUDIX hydrolase [Microgenomates group bacterium GW2011_GWC1_37_8]|uniref:8-oxo-dGTP diphosphatase n=1 Tax=Candidatus Woesebacteria bacterium GW2011_GWB1_38_8 TaxID=1618570 RepID=A0A0G0L150_9BACT|nr:MAG: NUDIX hydrolase [Microgenomates group bacterium GW2011_GWC1_37_8]KKQ84722.1 MAG: NUDIX hydrolase [Candidatus Woesebacteria bacterium GW2011_GWB1_38_8]
MKKYDVHKVGGIIIEKRKLLVERSIGRDHFIAPGGSIELNETPSQALVRELMEEFKILVKEPNLDEFGTFYASAAGQEEKIVRMDTFIVKSWQGEPTVNSEVEEILWLTSDIPREIKVGLFLNTKLYQGLKEWV